MLSTNLIDTNTMRITIDLPNGRTNEEILEIAKQEVGYLDDCFYKNLVNICHWMLKMGLLLL